MKKKRITYGVSGMMEYQAVIKVGRNNMKVTFSDGSMNAMGVNPAKFTTSDYMVQHAIENSRDFKRGLIFIFSTIELDEEIRIERPAPTPAPTKTELINSVTSATPNPPEPTLKLPTMQEETEQAAENEEPNTAESAEQGAEDMEESDAHAESAEQGAEDMEESDAHAESAEESIPGKVEVEFSVNDDARDYLEQNFGAERSKLRTRADILAAAETYGVDIKFV